MKAFKTIIILSLLYFADANHADAQRRKLNPMNSVYAEFYLITPDQSYGGLALSYERLFSPKKTISLKIGVIPNIPSEIIVVPVTMQGYTTGSREHHIEFGGGISPAFDYYEEFKVTVYPHVHGGYRYSRGTGLVFRAIMNVVVYPNPYPNPAISIGYLF